MRISITCEECGHRHRLARRVTERGPVWIVCHGCEIPLRADLPAGGATAPRAEPAGTTPLPAPPGTWAGLFSH